ncbi:MAG TPA: 2-C-methyl-D-erythritol 4-phosphate cytidylyltransferase [bacterium]|nr:2-C-methyl-D-erythritol 4-phosphate cytidylyltransferase [bacterium]
MNRLEKPAQASRVAVLIAAAGAGKRMGAGRPKQFLEIGGTPILMHTLNRFASCPGVNEMILIVPETGRREAERLMESRSFSKPFRMVTGGPERTDSVRLGLEAVHPDTDLVLIHDAVRPFVPEDKIGEVIRAVQIHGAALLAVPEKATVKRVQDGVIQTTLDRSLLWLAQTPQGFRYDLILQAYEAARRDGVGATDDAALVERLGHPVHVVMGVEQNIKITTRADLEMAEALLRISNQTEKSGF